MNGPMSRVGRAHNRNFTEYAHFNTVYARFVIFVIIVLLELIP